MVVAMVVLLLPLTFAHVLRFAGPDAALQLGALLAGALALPGQLAPQGVSKSHPAHDFRGLFRLQRNVSELSCCGATLLLTLNRSAGAAVYVIISVNG